MDAVSRDLPPFCDSSDAADCSDLEWSVRWVFEACSDVHAWVKENADFHSMVVRAAAGHQTWLHMLSPFSKDFSERAPPAAAYGDQLRTIVIAPLDSRRDRPGTLWIGMLMRAYRLAHRDPEIPCVGKHMRGNHSACLRPSGAGPANDCFGICVALLHQICETALAATSEELDLFGQLAVAIGLSRLATSEILRVAAAAEITRESAGVVRFVRAARWVCDSLRSVLDAVADAYCRAGYPALCGCGPLSGTLEEALRLVDATAAMGHGLDLIMFSYMDARLCFYTEAVLLARLLVVFCQRRVETTRLTAEAAKAALDAAEATARVLNDAKTLAHNAEKKKERTEWTNGQPPGKKGASRELKALRSKTDEAVRAWEAAAAEVVRAAQVYKDAQISARRFEASAAPVLARLPPPDQIDFAPSPCTPAGVSVVMCKQCRALITPLTSCAHVRMDAWMFE